MIYLSVAKTQDIHVKKVAKLGNLPLSQDEEKVFTDQLSKIVDYIDLLNKVDTSNVESTYNTTNLNSVLRDDKESPCQSQEEALANAPNKKDDFFVTKGVFDNE